MRKVVLVLVVLIVAALVVGFYPGRVERPVKDGSGPLGIRLAPGVPAPEHHNPLPWWQTHHMDVVNRGDLTEADCLHCHDPQTSCNNCHGYVGAREIQQPAGAGW